MYDSLCKLVQYSRGYDDSKTLEQVYCLSDLLTFQPPEANCNDLHIMMKQQKNVEESYDDLLLAVSVESHGHSLAENN